MAWLLLSMVYGASLLTVIALWFRSDHRQAAKIEILEARLHVLLSGKPTDELQALAKLSQRFHVQARASGFWPSKSQITDEWICMQLALIGTEVSEAVEAVRDGQIKLYYSGGKPEGVAAELADVIIRALDLGCGLELDLARAIGEKHAYNLTRPPKHGRRF